MYSPTRLVNVHSVATIGICRKWIVRQKKNEKVSQPASKSTFRQFFFATGEIVFGLSFYCLRKEEKWKQTIKTKNVGYTCTSEVYVLYIGFEVFWDSRHQRCWQQNASRIQILHHLETTWSDANHCDCGTGCLGLLARLGCLRRSTALGRQGSAWASSRRRAASSLCGTCTPTFRTALTCPKAFPILDSTCIKAHTWELKMPHETELYRTEQRI